MIAERVFVMLGWEPALGAFLYPVGVFGLPYGGDAGAGGLYVSWVPMTYERALTWRRRLARPLNAGLIDALLKSGQLAEVPVPGPRSALPDAVEALLDGLVVGLLPVLHGRGAG